MLEMDQRALFTPTGGVEVKVCTSCCKSPSHQTFVFGMTQAETCYFLFQGKGLMATFLYAPSDEDLKLRPEELACMGEQEAVEEVDGAFEPTALSQGSAPEETATVAVAASQDPTARDSILTLAEGSPSTNRLPHPSSERHTAPSRGSLDLVLHQVKQSGASVESAGRDSVVSVQSCGARPEANLLSSLGHHDDELYDLVAALGSPARMTSRRTPDGLRTPGRLRVTGGISSSTPPGSACRGPAPRPAKPSMTSIIGGQVDVASSLAEQQHQATNSSAKSSLPLFASSNAISKLALLKRGSMRRQPSSEMTPQKQQQYMERQSTSPLASPLSDESKASKDKGPPNDAFEATDLLTSVDKSIQSCSESSLSATRPPEFSSGILRAVSAKERSSVAGEEGLFRGHAQPGGLSREAPVRRPPVRQNSSVHVIQQMIKLMAETGGSSDYQI